MRGGGLDVVFGAAQVSDGQPVVGVHPHDVRFVEAVDFGLGEADQLQELDFATGG